MLFKVGSWRSEVGNSIRAISLFTFALFVGQINASAQQRLSLSQILKEVETNNLSLKAFESRIKSEDAKIAGAGAWMAPMIGVGTFMTPYPGQGMVEEGDKGALMVSAEQEIPNPAKVKARKEYQATRSETYFLGKTERLNELRRLTRQTYFDLLIDYKKMAVQKESLRIMQNMKKLAEIRYPLNQGALNQIFKAEGRLAESENMVEMTQGGIQSKKIFINTLMNRAPAENLEIDTSYVPSFSPVANLDTNYLADTRSDVLHMQHEIHSMKANINRIRQEAKPDLRLRFDHMGSYSAMMPRQFTLMGMVSIPIAPWSSKMYKADIASMNFEISAMQQEKRAMVTEMLGMIRGMEKEILSMQKQLDNYQKKIIPALRKNLNASMLSYQENKMDVTMVIDAWEALNMTQVNYLDQLQKYYKMIADYEKGVER